MGTRFNNLKFPGEVNVFKSDLGKNEFIGAC